MSRRLSVAGSPPAPRAAVTPSVRLGNFPPARNRGTCCPNSASKRLAPPGTDLLSKQIHLRRRLKLFELLAVLRAARGLSHVAFGREFAFLQVAEDDFRALQNLLRHAGQSRDMDAVALVRAALDDF